MKRTRPAREIGDAAGGVVEACRPASSESALMVKSRRCGVAGEIAAEPHDGVAPVGLDILAQGRDLEGRARRRAP